jgi:hypothetical protein
MISKFFQLFFIQIIYTNVSLVEKKSKRLNKNLTINKFFSYIQILSFKHEFVFCPVM